MLGYNGKLAYLDLTTKTTVIKDLEPEIAEAYIGGVGLSAKLTHDLLKDGGYDKLRKDPFDAVNPVIFATGPLTGTAAPSSSRYSVTGISPLTGIWGESTSGGFFPIALRRCGFDAIILAGKSESPVYMVVNDGTIEFKDAAPIWGLDSRKTIERIREELGEKLARVACIGQAGENLVRYAAIINDEGRAAGRCGIGALMGSKNVKALAARGKQKIEFADGDTIKKIGKTSRNNMQMSFSTNFFSHFGTLCYTDMGMVLGDIPANYFTNTEFVAEDLTGRALREQYPVMKYACAGCTIGCGRTTIADIEGQEVEVDGPEYETTAAFGPLCGVFDFKPIIEANHACNLQGIDTISSGVSIAFLLYLVNNEINIEEIEKRLVDIKIEELKWGNQEVVLKLLGKISSREDIGDLLAKGVRVMAKELGVDPELAAHVKGLEIPMHDPRAYAGQALTYMTACCGATHEKGDFFNIDGDAANFKKVKKGDRFDIDGREKSVMNLQDIANLFDSAVICNFPHVNMAFLSKLFKAATGFGSLGSKRKLLRAGERAFNLKRLISCKLGITKNDDTLPGIVTRVLTSGATAGRQLSLAGNLNVYYEARGWNENGIPTPEKLKELAI